MKKLVIFLTVMLCIFAFVSCDKDVEHVHAYVFNPENGEILCSGCSSKLVGTVVATTDSTWKLSNVSVSSTNLIDIKTYSTATYVIRTEGKTDTIVFSNPNANVYFYGDAESIDIKSVKPESAHVLSGTVKELDITSGHAVIEKNAEIEKLSIKASSDKVSILVKGTADEITSEKATDVTIASDGGKIFAVTGEIDASSIEYEDEKAPVRARNVFNMMGKSGDSTRLGSFPSSAAMGSDFTFSDNGVISGTLYQIDNTAFTEYAEGMTGYSYYISYALDIPSLTATTDKEGTYLIYKLTQANGTVVYGTSNSRSKCSKIADEGNETAAIKNYSIEYYLVKGTYSRVVNVEKLDAAVEALIKDKKPIVTIKLSKDVKFVQTVNAPAFISWRYNMMGSKGTSTKSGNKATSDALSKARIDEDGKIHAIFNKIDNTQFTAYSTGMTGSGYYACYSLNFDSLKDGEYIVYLITDVKGKTYYGTSNSRAKCTKIYDDGDLTKGDLKNFKVEYYVVEGEYTRTTNTEYTTLPEDISKLIAGKTPKATITIADDSVFNK